MLTAMVMTGHFVAHTVAERRYQVWVPAAYDPSRKWPAILFLHGIGERGDDGEAQTQVGLGRALREGKLDPQAIIVFPQCPLTQRWEEGALPVAVAALDRAMNDYAIDPRRVSLTGISMGGAGAWLLAVEQPQRFSALAPICGWAPPHPDQAAKRLGKMPVWFFHGSEDPVVPVADSRAMAAVLGANAAYTEFPGVKHNSWDPAYQTTGVIAWLLEQKRS